MNLLSTFRSSNPERMDKIGALASSLCAIHCALCALLPAAFGILGLGFLMSAHAELLLTLIAIIFALGAIILSLRSHPSKLVIALLSLGIISLITSRVLEMGSHHDHHEASEVHEHHEEAHHEEAHHGEAHHGEAHNEEAHEEGHEEGHGTHDDPMHAVGGLIGVFGGLCIFFGHLLNIRRARKEPEECCSTEESVPVS